VFPPIDEFMEADQLALIEEQHLIGKPRYTPRYLKCRSPECSSNAIIKRLDDGTFFDFVLKKGLYKFHFNRNLLLISCYHYC